VRATSSRLENRVEVEYHAQILEQARVDAMTSAYNKRYFDEQFPTKVHDARRRGTPLALVIFDIDHFKRINDTHGHAAGDAIIIQVVETSKALLEAGDVFCRVGGEEFAILLPGTRLELARALCERIRAAVQSTEFSFDGVTIPVTVSLGVGVHVGDESELAFYRRVDGCLYEAKRSGRNRVA
jgi:diguanylate cyclase (GGDEF)-like protein